MSDSSPQDIEDLLSSLKEQFGTALRSCVEYLPQSRSIHYLRDDIDRSVAEGRLIRINELYQAGRIVSKPITMDHELSQLDASIHFFGEVCVVHLVNPGARVIGFSLDSEALSDLQTLVSGWLDITHNREPESPD